MTTYLGESSSLGLLCVPFVNVLSSRVCASFHIGLRVGCEIVLYKVLIIAFLFIVFSIRCWSFFYSFYLKERRCQYLKDH